MRPDRPEWFMQFAEVAARRSTCMRLNVGCVIVFQRKIISIGYNGAPSGQSHCTGNDCPGKLKCDQTIHAEQNALRHMGTQYLHKNVDLYTTDSPCPDCAGLIIRHGVSRVFFRIPYRITDSLDMLREYNVEVYRVTPAGYVIEWGTNNLVEVET